MLVAHVNIVQGLTADAQVSGAKAIPLKQYLVPKPLLEAVQLVANGTKSGKRNKTCIGTGHVDVADGLTRR